MIKTKVVTTENQSLNIDSTPGRMTRVLDPNSKHIDTIFDFYDINRTGSWDYRKLESFLQDIIEILTNNREARLPSPLTTRIMRAVDSSDMELLFRSDFRNIFTNRKTNKKVWEMIKVYRNDLKRQSQVVRKKEN